MKEVEEAVYNRTHKWALHQDGIRETFSGYGSFYCCIAWEIDIYMIIVINRITSYHSYFFTKCVDSPCFLFVFR